MIESLIKEKYKNVCILGLIKDQSLLAQMYSSADVFLICSRRENFPTTCIEAQCCGTPVAGFHTGGTAETSLLGENNFVQYGDIKGLTKKVRTLLKGKTDRFLLAEKAKEEYSKETMFQKYYGLYMKNSEDLPAKILLVDVNCKHSSTGKIVYDLYSNIRKSGNDAAICYGRGEKIKEDHIYKFGLDWETYLHALLARITGLNGCFSSFSTRRLIRYIKEYRPDVIHIHELHAYFVNIVPLLRFVRKKGIRVIWTFHCEFMYTGKCGYAYECEKWKTECGKCPAVRDYPKSLFLDWTNYMFCKKKKLLEDLDMTIVAPSQWLADRVKQSFLRDKPVYVLHNGINTDVFHVRKHTGVRDSLHIPRENKIVFAAAPDIMSERKGGKWVLKMAEEMKRENVTFILGGKT